MKNKKIVVTKTEWDLTPLFASDTDPQIVNNRKLVTAANETFIKKWEKREDYLTDATVLLQALTEYETLMHNFGTDGKEGFYMSLRMAQNQLDPKLKAKHAQVVEFSNTLSTKLQFFELRLAKITPSNQKKFLSDKRLLDYKHFLEKIFSEAAYLLSEPEEKIMTLKSDPAYGKWVQMLSSFISKEERETILENGKTEKATFEQLLSLISSQKKNVRDRAFTGVNDILSKYTDVAENEINAILANKKVDDTLRGMPRPDFSRHISDDVASSTVDTLVNSVSGHYAIAKRFYALKAKLLGVPRLEYHERNVEYGKVDKTYSLDEGINFVYNVFSDLDSEFAEIFEGFLNNGQVDIFPRVGKRGGAFCAYWLLSQPTYILLNYTNKLRDVTTIAHEAGHGINNELMRKKQNALNFGTPTSTAEVASTFMEDFVLSEILKTADDETKLSVLMAKLNDEISTIFRQVAAYQFEQELHSEFRKSGYLSHNQIGQIFQKHMSAYMGPSVIQSSGSENWWIYWSHIRTFFYVYSYASGLLISKALQNKVKEDKKFVVNVKEFLSKGTSASPKDIFLDLGINIDDEAFWNRGLAEIADLLKTTEKLAQKLGKIK